MASEDPSLRAKARIYASFEVQGAFDPDTLTSALELQPTSVCRRGELIGEGPAYTKLDIWRLKSDEEEGFDLGLHVEEILELVRPRQEAIRSFVSTHEVTAWVYAVAVVPGGCAPYFELAPETLQAIADLGATFAIDFYITAKDPGLDLG